MRSYDELLVVSGYGSRLNEFDELLHILNCELRLISPIEPEGSESSSIYLEILKCDGQTKTQEGERFFLLTHDYLVPSIREWLTRKQKETRRGRAELRLVDRSSLWNAKPENRHLPSLLEWTNIGLLTQKKDWTEPQAQDDETGGKGAWAEDAGVGGPDRPDHLGRVRGLRLIPGPSASLIPSRLPARRRFQTSSRTFRATTAGPVVPSRICCRVPRNKAALISTPASPSCRWTQARSNTSLTGC